MAGYLVFGVSLLLALTSCAYANFIRNFLASLRDVADGTDNGGTILPVESCTSRLGEPGWVCWDQSCYLRLENDYSWIDAEDHCASQCSSAHLVVINSAEEDVFLHSTLQHGHAIWEGCSDADHEGHWSCVDHMGGYYNETTEEHQGYWPWDSDGHQPNGHAGENCALHVEDGDHEDQLLHDYPCTDTHTVVCEVPNHAEYHAVHLVDHSHTSHALTKGRVELHSSPEWGTICDDYFDINAAEVICHQLGFPSAVAAHCCAHFGQGTGDILLDNVHCVGNETSLLDCQTSELGVHDCTHYEDAGVTCKPPVRLSGPSGSYTGRVEVYVHDQWGTVCDDFWDDIDATVVCRQLGYAAGKVGPFMGEGGGDVLLDDVDCAGTEESLLHCVYSGIKQHNCHHTEDATVICGLQVRLTGGSNPSEGRVEVLYEDEWGTVCDDQWDINDANIVCRQLGFDQATEATTMARFGPGTGNIIFDGVGCVGDEHALSECSNTGLEHHDCTHSEDAGVICINEGNLRLVDGDARGSGRVEIFKNGEWGTVCDDSWDIHAANVVCKQLGFYSAKEAISGGHFDQGEGPIHLDDVVCNGSEHELLDCHHGDLHNCNHGEDAGVICSRMTELRLIGGRTNNEGHVEVGDGDIWGSVCGNGWDISEAKVVCHQLGFSGAIGAYHDGHFGEGTGDILLKNVHCTGNETAFVDCTHEYSDTDCTHEHDASVICTPNVRIVNGPSPNMGRVEVYLNHEWGTVCDDGWDLGEASIVCHQLGFSSAQFVTNFARFGQGTGPIQLDDLECSGTESALTECQHSGLGNNNCGHHEDAGVICSPPVRLVGGETPLSGRLEVFAHGVWGTVCDDGWGHAEADVVCRQLHHKHAQRASTNAEFSPGSGPIHLDDVSCIGNEWTVFNCAHNDIGENNCRHSEDAGVVCVGPSTDVLRLVDGQLEREGRIEVLSHDNEWGTICDDHFDLLDATVICRQLGYPTAEKVYHSAHFGQGSGPIVFDDLECTGIESAVDECNKTEIGNCGHYEDAGILCAPKVGLVGGPHTHSGMVRVYDDHAWGTVCDDWWNIADGNVLCHELGYPSAISVFGTGQYGAGFGEIILDIVECDGTERNLFDCPHLGVGVQECSHRGRAAVICEPKARLAGGTTSHEGRVEIYADGHWGTICDDQWDIDDANVVCKQLGYPEAVEAFGSGHFGHGSGTILLDDLECMGDERDLTHCVSRLLGDHNCEHDEDAGVECANKIRLVDNVNGNDNRVEVFDEGEWQSFFVTTSTWDIDDATRICKAVGFHSAVEATLLEYHVHEADILKFQSIDCIDGATAGGDCHFTWHQGPDTVHAAGVICREDPAHQIRLSGGRTANEGRVEVKSEHDEWGTVCDDDWDQTDANLVCHQLGFSGVLFAHSEAHYGEDDGLPIVMDEVHCHGDELSINECPHSDAHDCSHSEDVSVICQPNVRLVGPASNVGRVELFANGEWGSICDDGFDLNVAKVLCRQMGFQEALVFVNNAHFGHSDGPIHLDDVHCTGEESSILDCESSGLGNNNCNHNEDAGIICTAPIRLAGGESPASGRVEMFYNGTWGTVCNDDWDMHEANIVCRQVGYGPAIRTAAVPEFEPGLGPILLHGLECTESEDDLLECHQDELHGHDCHHNDDAGVVCSESTHGPGLSVNCHYSDDAGVVCSEPTHEPMRLVGGGREERGRVEIMKNGVWGTVCDDHFGQSEATVVCRSLGFPGPAEVMSFGPGEGLIYYDDLDCLGSEKSLADCRHETVHNCVHEEDVGVVCIPKVNLIGISKASSGVIILYHDGIFGKVCPDSWDIDDANVICHQLGYPSALAASTEVIIPSYFSEIILGDVECTGTESSIFDCPHSQIGQHDCANFDHHVAGVTCEPSVRLVGGPHLLEGRVEIYAYGLWYTVCDDQWDIADAHVVCRQIGTPGAVEAYSDSHFGHGVAPILLDDLNCDGSESSLLQCPSLTAPGSHNCGADEHAGVKCAVGARLVDGASLYDGHFEAYTYGEWKAIMVTENGWNMNSANHFCRNMGSDSARAATLLPNTLEDSTKTIKLESVTCPDNMPFFTECPHTLHVGSEQLFLGGLVCLPAITARLMGGHTPNEGRVEVSVNHGEWGTVCDDAWDIHDATVVCHQLGYPAAIHAYSQAHFGQGTGEIQLDEVNCNGTEESLTYCSYSGIAEHNCLHSEDASIECEPRVRLVNGSTPNEGRVEVYINGTWGTICDNNWDIVDVIVVCQELGYSLGASATENAHFGEGSGHIHMADVHCHSSDSSIVDCSHSDVHSCTHHNDAGVICSSGLIDN